MNERSFTFTISSDLTFQVEFAGDAEIDVYGSYVISVEQITFTDKAGDYSSGTSGVYKFQVSDTSITFTEIDDSVNGRRMLVEGTWTNANVAE